MQLIKSEVQRFYREAKHYVDSLDQCMKEGSGFRSFKTRRAISKSIKGWLIRMLTNFNEISTDQNFSIYTFSDLVISMLKFGVDDIQTACDVLTRMGFELVD